MPATRFSARLLRRLERAVLGLVAIALAAILLGVVVADRQTRELEGAERWVTHTYDVIGQLDALDVALHEAESAERGFALTGDTTLLGPFARVQGAAAERLAAVRALVSDNPRQVRRAGALAAAVAGKVDAMDAVVRARREGPADGGARAAALIARGVGPAQMRAVEGAVESMKAEELGLLARRRAALTTSTARSAALGRGLGAGAVGLMLVGGLAVRGARARQRAAERQTAAAHAELHDRVAELEARGRESRALSGLTEALQLCVTPAEAYAVLARIIPDLVPAPTAGGLLAVMRASRNRVERAASWGTLAGESTLAFVPDECCALRSGRPYVLRADEPRLRCPHAAAGAAHYVCLPLLAHGETLGVIHLVCDDGSAFEGERALALLQEGGEYIAVALANLALRERLTQQSIRDPLTGAFNRRYLEESLDREVARARRHRTGMGVLMLDVDHFKRFNDTHGHEAGDEVLRLVAEVLRRAVREEDVVCRYGGEEFAVLLPDITADVARARAEAIAATLRGRPLSYRGASVGPVTASIGVAHYPDHGDDGAELVRRADAALYAAKRAGRDRVAAAEAAG